MLSILGSAGSMLNNMMGSIGGGKGGGAGGMMGSIGAAGNSGAASQASGFLTQGVKKSKGTAQADAAYDGIANAVSSFGPWGAAIGGIMKIGGLATDGLNKLGFKTDQLTTADKILDSKFLKLTPVGMSNTAFAKKSKTFVEDKDTSAAVQGSYTGYLSNMQKVRDKSGKYGALSSAARKRQNRRVNDFTAKQDLLTEAVDESSMAKQNAQLNAQDATMESQMKKLGGFNPVAVGKEGMKLQQDWARNLLAKKGQIKAFKEGGKLEQSLIPGGALHAHKHSLKSHDGALADAVTDKGVPVVTFEEGGEIEQHAEIERGEIIFRKEITEQLEKLWKDGSDKAMIEAGKLIAEEVVNNTKDKSGEYEIENK